MTEQIRVITDGSAEDGSPDAITRQVTRVEPESIPDSSPARSPIRVHAQDSIAENIAIRYSIFDTRHRGVPKLRAMAVRACSATADDGSRAEPKPARCGQSFYDGSRLESGASLGDCWRAPADRLEPDIQTRNRIELEAEPEQSRFRCPNSRRFPTPIRPGFSNRGN